jgi:AraC-like DNA-binding protein
MRSRSDQIDKVPVVYLDKEVIPREHQFAALHQAAFPLFDTVPLKDSHTYACSCTSYLVDQLVFTHTQFDKMQFMRPATQLSGQRVDHISLQYYQSGQIKGYLEDGTPLLMQPDRISIQDFAHAYSGIGETTNNFGVVIPRHLITAHKDIYQHRPMFSWTLDSPQGRLLNSILFHIWQELPQLTIAQAPAVAQGLVGFLNGLLSDQRDSQRRSALRAATLQAMQDYIRANLHNPSLGVEQLCEHFYCSRATVYRFFKPAGGVKTYLQDQRLERCYHDLKRLGQISNSAIRGAATRWGFSNTASFTRLFQQRYGVAPSEMGNLALAELDRQQRDKPGYWADVYRLRQWLECA